MLAEVVDSMLLLLAVYSFACIHIVRLSRIATVRSGVAAGTIALLANVSGVLFGGVARAFVALAVATVGGLAATHAFKIADDMPRDTDEERHASRAGTALVGMTITECLIVLVAGFIWIIARGT